MSEILRRHFQFKVFGAAIFLCIHPLDAIAGPKDECELVVGSLGFDTDDYAFKKGGLFSSDQHIFGSLSCYVDHEGKFQSLYRGDTAVAEDGFFGVPALEARDAAMAAANAADERAAKKRDEAISKARETYDSETEDIAVELAATLLTIQENSMQSIPSETSSASDSDTSVFTPGKAQPDLTHSGAKNGAGDPENERESSTEVIPQPVAGREMWVAVERLNIRSCPGANCGRTGWILAGERIVVYEEKNGWARISEPYLANCISGITDQIDDGDRRCVSENGISDGKIAKWVAVKHLSPISPIKVADPNDCSSGFLAASDNYEVYAEVFCEASRKLIEEGRCTEDEFIENGGWWASTSHPKGTFFTYCGDAIVANRIYLDAQAGRIFQ